MNTISLLYTTMVSIIEAEKLAEQAILEKYVTCVNIIPNALSIYAWEGKIEKSSECLLILKTSTNRVEDLQSWLKTQHPYTLPALLQGDVTSSPEFTHYIHEHLKDKS